jgi:hypothetical protein
MDHLLVDLANLRWLIGEVREAPFVVVVYAAL